MATPSRASRTSSRWTSALVAMSNLSIAVRGDAPNRYRQDSPPLLSWPGGRLTRSSAAHDTDRTGGAVADTARGRGEGNPPGAQPGGGDHGGPPTGDGPALPVPGPAPDRP